MVQEMKKIIRDLRKSGWTATQSRKHWRLKGPGGELVFAGCTPSDHRSIANLRAMLKRPPVKMERRAC